MNNALDVCIGRPKAVINTDSKPNPTGGAQMTPSRTGLDQSQGGSVSCNAWIPNPRSQERAAPASRSKSTIRIAQTLRTSR
jgi:hypothetical protein